jgi:hypothetical protein
MNISCACAAFVAAVAGRLAALQALSPIIIR